jgi:hypothetical protein
MTRLLPVAGHSEAECDVTVFPPLPDNTREEPEPKFMIKSLSRVVFQSGFRHLKSIYQTGSKHIARYTGNASDF